MNRYKNQYNSLMKQLKNREWFSIVLAMWIVLSISLTIIYLMEYVIPFSKDTKWIEFSSNAFYQSSSAVEDALFYVANNNLWDEASDALSIGWWSSGIAGNTDWWFNIVARWDVIPPPWEWNSEYDPDWNKLAPGKPLQLEIGADAWNLGSIEIRVPDTWAGNFVYLKPMNWGIVAWQLSAAGTTLNSWIGTNRIEHNILKTWYPEDFNIKNKSGTTLDGAATTFQSFYDANCDDSLEKCTLKLSIINDLILDNSNSTPIPYLEYKISWINNAPLRYTQINAEWFSNGFKKDIDIKIPQQTVNEAFDFTVFQ